jgi:hypothetical protein
MSDFDTAGNAPVTKEEVEVTHFRAPLSSCKYVFRNGKVADFVNHIYSTRSVPEINELTEELEHLALVKTTSIHDIEELENPIAAIRAKLRRELLAEIAANTAAAANPNNDAGFSVQGALKAASTQSAVDSSSAMSAAINAANPNGGGPQTFDISAMLAAVKK